MTNVADDAVLGKFTRRFKGLIERAVAGSLDLEKLWDIIQAFLDGKLEGVEGVFAGTHRIIEIKKPSPQDLGAFFTTRPGLYVLKEFSNGIVFPALKMSDTPMAKVGTPLVPDKMTETEIRERLGEKYIFEDVKAFCLYLADAIERQWDGVRGDLLLDRDVTLFYVRVNGEIFSVLVVRLSGETSKWCIGMSSNMSGPLMGVRRVFPCAD